jgi:signal transduction histidine kinase
VANPHRPPSPKGDHHLAASQTDLALLAHELRRRMAAVRVISEALAMRSSSGDDLQRMLGLLHGEVDDLDRVADEVLQSAMGSPAEQEADVIAAIRAAAATVSTARGAVIQVAVPDVPIAVKASATMLRQAVENLLDNAARYADAGPVQVDVRPDTDAGLVEVVVADRGPGPPLAGAIGRRQGYGLGLVLLGRFLDAVGGHAWVSERPGGGSLVAIRLLMPTP